MAIIESLKSFWKKQRYAISVTFLALAFFAVNLIQFNSNQSYQKKLEVAEYNASVYEDSLRFTRNKLGEVEANHKAFLTTDYAALKKLNKDLADEVAKVKGTVSTIIKTEVKIVEKEVPVYVEVEVRDSTAYAYWKYDTTYSPKNYKKLSGFTAYNLRTGKSFGQKTTDEIGVGFVTGIKNLDKGRPEIFLTSNYPGFQVTELSGAVLDPKLFKKNKPRKLSFGLQVGYSPLAYDLGTKTLGLKNQITAGVGFGYRIF